MYLYFPVNYVCYFEFCDFQPSSYHNNKSESAKSEYNLNHSQYYCQCISTTAMKCYMTYNQTNELTICTEGETCYFSSRKVGIER